ncbi:MAG: hypothetical protein JWR33_1990 [Naasia sp.]|uniref:hypothetical protein n=1 Tax=Naasia sp. TaxID=2546198 RepID=UPI00260D1C87|nr:hypothetical protein [Naasia sp.]MCU1571249.1 hypothetical protein [Naasia sp.]
MILPLVSVLHTVLLVLFCAAAPVLSLLAWRGSPAALVYPAAAAVAAALLLAAVPTGDPGFGVVLLLTMLMLVAAVVGGGPAATLALRLAVRGSIEGEHGGILQNDREVLRGGMAIGLLERLAIAAVILAGFPEGLAIVVAIKGVGRFTELDDAETRERFIIGTFASFLWAACCAGVVLLARS